MPRKPRYQWGLQLIDPSKQVRGSFDQERIVEQKMIAFSGEGGLINRLGALYYWAWGQCLQAPAQIPLHPHRGFEIFTYLISGHLLHRDSLGNQKLLEPEQWQLMQTGSGIEHEELFQLAPIQMFQIWFDPGFRQEIERDPVYYHETSRWKDCPGGRVAPIVRSSKTDSGVCWRTPNLDITDLYLHQEADWVLNVRPNRSVAALVLSGQLLIEYQTGKANVEAGWFWYLNSNSEEQARLRALQPTRLFMIEVDLFPEYALFPKPK